MNRSADSQMGEALAWALESTTDPSIVAANWLARDINRSCRTAFELIADHSVTIQNLFAAKEVFKTLRIMGETAADRRLGGRLYVAAIAAALVRHDQRITTQADVALMKAMRDLETAPEMPDAIRDLATRALAVLFTPGTTTVRSKAKGRTIES